MFICDWIYKNWTKYHKYWNPNHALALMIYSCTVQPHQLCGYRWPGLLSRTAFCQPCRAMLVHYRSCWATGGALIRIGCVSDCCQWRLDLSCGLCMFLLSAGTQHYCLWPNCRECPPSACPPAPTTPRPLPTHPSFYKRHPWYYRGCKKTILETSSE